MEFLFGVFQVIPLLVIALIVFAVASASGRRDPDPTGQRPYGVYLAIVSFFSLFVLLFSATFLAAALSEIAQDPDFATDRSGGAVLSGLIAVAAALVFLFHSRRLRVLANDSMLSVNAPRSTYHVYLYAVCMLGVLTALVAGALAVFLLLRLTVPSIVGGEDGGSVTPVIATGFLAIAAFLMFVFHWRRAAALRAPTSEPSRPNEPPRPEAAPPL